MDNDELNLSEDLNIADALTEAEDEMVGYVGGQNQTNQQIEASNQQFLTPRQQAQLKKEEEEKAAKSQGFVPDNRSLLFLIILYTCSFLVPNSSATLLILNCFGNDTSMVMMTMMIMVLFILAQ